MLSTSPVIKRVDPASIPQRVLYTGATMPAIGLGTFGSDHVIGFSPIGSPGRPERDRTPEDTSPTEDPVIVEIARNHGVHPAVVCIKWAVQRGQTPIPFSVNPRNYLANLQGVADLFLMGTLAAFAVGRFMCAYLMRFFASYRMLGVFASINVLLVAVGVLFSGWTGLWAIFLTSLFMSLMFPTIFALGIKQLGPSTKLGCSLLIMSIIGGAVLTPVMGLIAEATHRTAIAYVVPLFGFACVAAYAFFGATLELKPEEA